MFQDSEEAGKLASYFETKNQNYDYRILDNFHFSLYDFQCLSRGARRKATKKRESEKT
jgi:hypothetical protein